MSTLILFLHVLSGFVLFSGVLLAATGLEMARRRSMPSEIALVLLVARAGAVFVMAGTLAVLGFGLWLVEQRGYNLGDTWILGAIALLIAASVLGAIGGRRPKEARLLAMRLAADGDRPSQRLAGLLEDRTSLLLNYSSAAAIVGILALMIWKP